MVPYPSLSGLVLPCVTWDNARSCSVFYMHFLSRNASVVWKVWSLPPQSYEASFIVSPSPPAPAFDPCPLKPAELPWYPVISAQSLSHLRMFDLHTHSPLSFFYFPPLNSTPFWFSTSGHNSSQACLLVHVSFFIFYMFPVAQVSIIRHVLFSFRMISPSNIISVQDFNSSLNTNGL